MLEYFHLMSAAIKDVQCKYHIANNKYCIQYADTKKRAVYDVVGQILFLRTLKPLFGKWEKQIVHGIIER